MVDKIMEQQLTDLMKKNKIKLNADTYKYINNLVVSEYINEFYGRAV